MRRRTGADERRWVDADKLLDGMDAARIADEAREAKEQAAVAQQRSEVEAEENAARQARFLQIDRLHSTWAPSIKNCLNALGKRTWGLGKYEIVDDVDPDAYWREYQVKGLEWHERTDRYRVRNQDDWYSCEYRLGYRLRLEVKGDQYILGSSPLTEDSLKQWFLGDYEDGCPQCVEEHLIRLY
ncbi:MAG: hypothetical protein M1546_12180 [Chloroflexi bacterium]|nr:hypothetical protein [Chloroflexota bacterium]